MKSRFGKALQNEIPGITSDIFRHSESEIYGNELRCNKILLSRTFILPFSFRGFTVVVPGLLFFQQHFILYLHTKEKLQQQKVAKLQFKIIFTLIHEKSVTLSFIYFNIT